MKVLALLACGLQVTSAKRTQIHLHHRALNLEAAGLPGGVSWDDSVDKLKDAMESTQGALDILGWEGANENVEIIGNVLPFLKGHSALVGDSNDEGEEEAAWQEAMTQHQEEFTQALQDLEGLEGRLQDNSDALSGSGFAGAPDSPTAAFDIIETFDDCKHCRKFRDQLVSLPLDEAQAKVEAIADTTSTLRQLSEMCTGQDGDMSEGIYARLWRLGEVFRRGGKKWTKKAAKALRDSAYEAIIRVQASAAQRAFARTLCPAAAQAVVKLLERNTTSDDESINDRVSFLLSILNDPAAPEECSQIYRQIELGSEFVGTDVDRGWQPTVRDTCMCNPGQCQSKPAGAEEGVKWSCSPCGSSSCHLFWQQEQCEDDTGCLADADTEKVVLGSKLATQELLRRELYLDPSCKGITDCLKRRLGEKRWRQLHSYGKTLLAVKKDYIAIAAIAGVGAKLLEMSGGSSLMQQSNTTSGQQEKSRSAGVDVAEVVKIVRPALLSYLWIRVRMNQVRERASAKGFCHKSAIQLSLMADAQQAPETTSNVASKDAPPELGEVIASALNDGKEENGQEERHQAAKIESEIKEYKESAV